MLHTGVYTKEFASMLFASALSFFAYFIIRPVTRSMIFVRYISIITIFVIIFLGARKYIFRESYLKAEFDENDKTVEIVRSGFITKKTEKIPFGDISSVEIGSRKFVPQNIDGIKFVQRISLQHGSAIPGLDEEEEYVTLSLNLTDGTERIIYSGRIEEEPELPVNEIRNILNT